MTEFKNLNLTELLNKPIIGISLLVLGSSCQLEPAYAASTLPEIGMVSDQPVLTCDREKDVKHLAQLMFKPSQADYVREFRIAEESGECQLRTPMTITWVENYPWMESIKGRFIIQEFLVRATDAAGNEYFSTFAVNFPRNAIYITPTTT